jgi:hypothetical protein
MVKHRLLAAFVVLMLAAGCSSSNPDSAREADLLTDPWVP